MASATSIGELNERSLHRALKARYAVTGSAIEHAIDGYVADVVIGNRIIEVHTGSFSPLPLPKDASLFRRELQFVFDPEG